MKPTARLIRLAVALHAQLVRCESWRPLCLPVDIWGRTERLVARIRRADSHGWKLAAGHLRTELQYVFRSLLSQVEACDRELAAVLPSTYIASVTEIYADLIVLEQDFGGVAFCAQDHSLSVTTRSIVLEGRHLGHFEIRLDWQRLRQEAAYRVIARDPRPAATQDEVTHPHIRGEILCEGEGHIAIRRALAQGRFLDFFELVLSVLETYNGDSAFVGLDEWEGLSCADCDEFVDREYGLDCKRCDATVCRDCKSICGRCEANFCSDCIASCASCRDAHCGRCLSHCSACQELMCSECLDLNERCPYCDQQEEISDACSDPKTQETRTPLLTDGLGQTPLPA